MIQNLQLNLTLAYVGGSNSDLVTAVNSAAADNKSTLFYRWWPDPLVTLVGGVRVAFPDYSTLCFDSHDQNVTKSGVTCDLEVDVLKSIFRKDLKETDPTLHSFLTKMNFASGEIESMLKALDGGGGTDSVDQAACKWVKGNVERWEHWVPAEVVTVTKNQTTTRTTYIPRKRTREAEIGGGLVTLLALALAGFCWWRRHRDQDEAIRMSIRSFNSVQTDWKEVQEGLFTDGQSRNWQIELGQLEFGEPLGKGAAGTVYAAKYNGMDVAVKQLQVSSFDDTGETVTEAQSEAKVLGTFFHPNIIRFYGVAYADEKETQLASERLTQRLTSTDILPDPKGKHQLQTWASAVDQCVKQNIFIVLEQCKYSLKDVVYGSKEKYVLDTPSLFNMFEQITAGMAYLHKHEVLHRDLKPGNILVDSQNTVKIADFGTAKMNEERQDGTLTSKRRIEAIQQEREMTAFVGTPVFMAPEIMTDEGRTARYGDKADVYSLGMTMWSLWTRQRPFADEKHAHLSMFTLLNAVAEGARPKVPKDTPPLLSFLIQDCWQKEPEKRPSMEHLLEKLRTYKHDTDDDPADETRRASVSFTKMLPSLQNVMGDIMGGGGSHGRDRGASRETARRSRATTGDPARETRRETRSSALSASKSKLLGRDKKKKKKSVGLPTVSEVVTTTENPMAIGFHASDVTSDETDEL
jgi:serine/threonine protein kinase